MYGTIAQVIPVFLLTGIVELRFIETFRTEPQNRLSWRVFGWMNARARHRAGVAVVAVVFAVSIVGVLAAITATSDGGPGLAPWLVHGFAILGLACSVAFVVGPVTDKLVRLWKDQPEEGED
jgi:hypothetical protein